MAGNVSLFENFMPHGMCYLWRPDILWLNVLSDAAIGMAYFFITFALLYFLRKKREIPFPVVIYMFCVFIFACGVSHMVSIWTVWHGQYGVQGLVKAFTAVASVATAILLLPITPKLLALRSPRELELSNLALQDQIEQRKTSELQSHKLQSDLARLGRITTVGQMATGLAHELNQPLQVISASADTAKNLAQSSADTDPILQECLEDIQTETLRAGEIIRALRQFVSKKSTNRTLVDMKELVEQAVRLMAGDARNADVRIVVNAVENPKVKVDKVQVAQVLVNLIRNAVEAIANDQGSRLQESRVTIDIACEGEQVKVVVSDNGPGLPPGIDPFKAFETNKIDGMGVGLSISRDISDSHGGSLEYNDNWRDGASFILSLPASLPARQSESSARTEIGRNFSSVVD